jgi:plasmid maintenance system antidote protein VapI
VTPRKRYTQKVHGFDNHHVQEIKPWDPDWVVHPGETLEEWFQYSNVPRSVAWKIYGITEEQLAGILAGTQQITVDLAERLGAMTHIAARMWMALEHNFRVGLAAGKNWWGAPGETDGS